MGTPCWMSEPRTVERSFDCSMASPRLVRQFVREVLDGWLVVETADDVVLIAHELATNALVHARSDYLVRLLRREGWVRIEVDDASMEPPMAADPSPSSLRGRGLVLVDGLADAWGWEVRDGGKSVWVEISAPVA